VEVIEPWKTSNIKSKLDDGKEITDDELDNIIHFWSYINDVAVNFNYNLLMKESNRKVQKYSRIKANR